MDNRNKDSFIILKSGLWYTISNFLTRAMVFITTPIFSRILTTEQFGNFHVFANWQSMFLIICGAEIYATINRARFDFKDERSLNAYISSCLVLSSIITGAVFCAYLVFPGFFEKVLLMDRKYILIMFVYLFTYPAFEMFQVQQRVHYRYKVSSTVSFGAILICSSLAVFLAYRMESDRLFGRVLGQYMPLALGGLFLYIMFMKKSHSIKTYYWRYAVRIAVPLIFSYLAGQIMSASDKITVQHLSSSEAVAYLGIATSCSHIMTIFLQCLNSAWSPWFYDKLNRKEYPQIRKAFKIFLWLVISCTFGVLMIGPELVKILGGSNYLLAIYLLPPNMLGGLFNLIITQFGSLETFHQKAYYAAVFTSIASVTNLILDIIFVKIFGYMAASYITVFCYILLIIIHFWASKSMDSRLIFPMKNIGQIILAALMMIPLSLIIYKNNFVRWCIIFVMAFGLAGIAVIKRTQIIHLMREIKKG